MDDDVRNGAADLGSREPGEDPDDPYNAVVVSELPEWWRTAVQEFEDAGLRPYRPPRFEDGRLTPPVIGELESDLDVNIRFRCFDAAYGDDWDITVDGESIGAIGRHRSPDGHTVYELASDSFEELIYSNAEESDTPS